MKNKRKYVLGIGLLILLFSGMFQLEMAGAPGSEIEKIKSRVSEYFTALHNGEIEIARELIHPQSRKSRRAGQLGDSSIIAFNILRVDIEEGGNSAIVEISREALGPAVVGRITVKEKYRWKLVSGEWFFDPNDTPMSDSLIFRDYYHKKNADRATAKKNGETPIPLEVEFDKKVFDFGIAIKGTSLKVKFPFDNLAKEKIKVEKIFFPEWFIKDVTKVRNFKPGENGEILFNLDTSKFLGDVRQDIFVQFEPIKELIKLTIEGEVYREEDIPDSRKKLVRKELVK